MDDRTMAIVSIVLLFLMFVTTFLLYFKLRPNRSFNHVRFIARVGIFGAMATVLYIVPGLTFQLPFFPSFLSFHFDEIPALICGFAYGPFSGFMVIVIKTLIKLPMTSTATVGEFGDLILSTMYVVPCAFIYKKIRNLKGVAIGFGISTVIQIVAAMVLNVYALIPLYQVIGLPLEMILGAIQAANPAVHDAGWGYALMVVAPFNAMKDAIVIVVTFLVYRSIHKFLRFEKID